jgi:LysR family glycine cleavage system transcriptional activator
MPSLRAFEAAARLGSFAEAALELSMTPSAISHQVRALEAFMRVPLFVRERRRVRLSFEGQRLHAAVQRLLLDLGQAIAELRPQRLAARVTVLPSIAHRWLMPRLVPFMAQHPRVDLHLSSSQSLADLSSEGFDLGVRFGSGHWPGLHSTKLALEALLPVASPRLLEATGRPDLSLLARATLLRDEFHPWGDYFRARGIDARGLHFGAQFGDSAQLLTSAESGGGVALARSWLCRDALKRGLLVAIGPPLPLEGAAYYLVSRRPLAECSAGAQAFAHWLLSTFRAEAQALALA